MPFFMHVPSRPWTQFVGPVSFFICIPNETMASKNIFAMCTKKNKIRYVPLLAGRL